jgi:hypothetical protein
VGSPIQGALSSVASSWVLFALGLVDSSLPWSEPGLLFSKFPAKLSMGDLVSKESIHQGLHPILY